MSMTLEIIRYILVLLYSDVMMIQRQNIYFRNNQRYEKTDDRIIPKQVTFLSSYPGYQSLKNEMKCLFIILFFGSGTQGTFKPLNPK